MKNPYKVEVVGEHDYGTILGHSVLVTEWSDGCYTVFASTKEYGTDYILLENETVWETRPSEDEIKAEIDEEMERRYDAMHS